MRCPPREVILQERDLHVVLVSQDYPPESLFSGIGTYSKALAHSLVGLGHRVTVIMWQWKRNMPEVYDDEGVEVHRIVPLGTRFVGRDKLILPVRASAGVYARIRKIHEQRPIDVIEFHDSNGVGAVTSVLGSIPTVARAHGTHEFEHAAENRKVDGRHARLASNVEATSLRRADLVVAVSNFIKESYDTLYSLSPGQFAVQPLALSAPGFLMHADGSHQRHHRRGGDRGPVFLYSGRFDPRKRPHTLIEAFARTRLRDARLIMVGGDTNTAPDGTSMRQYCARLAQELGVAPRVQFLDRVPQEELLHHYLSSDVLVVPSLYETFGLVFLEAMAVGLPVIGTTLGASQEVVSPSCGVLVPPDDVVALAGAMEKLGMEPELRRAMGQAGRKLVLAKYTPERHAEAMVDHYRRAIGISRSRRRGPRLLRLVLLALGLRDGSRRWIIGLPTAADE